MNYFKSFAIAAVLPFGFTSLMAQTNEPLQLPPVSVMGTAPIPQSDSSATSVVSGDEVRVGEITSVRDLGAQEPNLTIFDGSTDRTPKFSVRGFRENNFAVGEPVVGMYVDDVPYYDLNSRGLSLYNVDSIQFARGEQGTLYGASGVGGVMNIITKQPGNEWHGSGTLGYGDYNAQNYQAGAGGPLVSNKLFLSLDGLYSLRGGYVNNLFDGSHPDTQNTLSGRAELRWTPSAPWTIALSASGERFHDGFVPTYRPSPVFLGPPPAAAGPDPSPFSVNRNLDGFVHTSDDNQALKISYEAGPVILSSVTTHRDWRQNLAQDFDFTALPAVAGYDLTGYSQPRIEQWGEELHFKSPDSQEKFKWLGGFYYLDNDLKSFSGFTPGGTPTTTDSDGKTYAVFGQATQTVFDKLDLTLGLRGTFDQRHMQGSVLNFAGKAMPVNSSDQFTALQPKFAVAWHFTPEAEVYASVAEGYQSGGFNPFLNNSEYGPARPLEYELGVKTSWLDNKLTANAALFYTDTSGYQVVRVNPADPVLASLLNAHRAVTYGAELELTAKPTSDLDLNAGFGYTRAQYENFLDPTSGLQLAGQPISFVPEFTANLAATYHFPWHIYVRGEVIGIGRYHMDDTETATSGPTIQDAYELVNVQAGYKVKNFDFYLYARNVFDRHYYNNAINFGVGAALPYSSLILQPGDPETCGVALTASF